MDGSTMPAVPTVLSVELQAEQWNVVLLALQEVAMPHRAIDPVLRSIYSQLQQRQMMPSHAAADAEGG